ncbi:MAG: hypothetical protein MUP81_00190 [Dehalococcoidia bacterium]|nr:hypothetical protein [Dehalococcoidia bacterium]
MDIDTLKGKLNQRLIYQQKAYANRKVKLRELYAYAKERGFSASEAQILSFTSKEDIDKLVTERLEAEGRS